MLVLLMRIGRSGFVIFRMFINFVSVMLVRSFIGLIIFGSILSIVMLVLVVSG